MTTTTMMTMNKYNAHSENGFTLVEILLAIGILGFMMTLTYGAVTSIIRTKKVLEDEQEIERIEHVLVRRLTQELQLATTSAPRLPPENDLKKRFHSYENLLGKEDSLPNGKPGDEITFVALSGGQYFLEGKNSNAGLVQIRYRVAEDPERESQEDYDVYSLIREEVPLKRPYEKAYEKAVRFPLLEIVEGFKLEYFDFNTGEWSREWGEGDKRNLPSLVRFSIELRSPRGKKRTISETVPLRAERVR